MSSVTKRSNSNQQKPVPNACQYCRRRKIRCINLGEKCKACMDHNVQCVYSNIRRKPGPPKGYWTDIKTRWKSNHVIGHQVDTRAAFKANMGIKQRKDTVSNDLNNSSNRIPTAKDIVGDMYSLQLDDNCIGSRYFGECTGLSFVLEELHFNPAGILPCPMDSGSVFRKVGKGVFNLRTKDQPGKSGTFDLLTQLSQTEGLELAQGNKSGIIFNVDNAPQSILDALIEIYFDQVHPYYPVINKSIFLLQYRSENLPSPPVFLVQVMYAAAAVVSVNLPIDMMSFYQRAQELVSLEMDHPRLSVVQALLLLSNFHSLPFRSWGCSLTYMNVAITMAMELALHRDPLTWSIPKVEKAMRRRVFWFCFLVDRWRAAMTGNGFMIREDEYSTEMPLIDEYDSPIEGMYAIEVARLSILMGKILKQLYLPIRLLSKDAFKQQQQRKELGIVNDLKKDLNMWQASVPQEFTMTSMLKENISKESNSFAAHLNLMYHALNILLYRKFLHQGLSSNQTISTDTALSECYGSCRQILSIALYHLSVQDAMRYGFTFNMYAIFNAVVIWIHLIGIANSLERTNSSPGSMNIIMVKVEEAASPPPPLPPISPRTGVMATLSMSHPLIKEARAYLSRATQMLHEFQLSGCRLITPMLGTIYCLAGLRHVIIEAPELSMEDDSTMSSSSEGHMTNSVGKSESIEADEPTIAQIVYSNAALTFDSSYIPSEWMENEDTNLDQNNQPRLTQNINTNTNMLLTQNTHLLLNLAPILNQNMNSIVNQNMAVNNNPYVIDVANALQEFNLVGQSGCGPMPSSMQTPTIFYGGKSTDNGGMPTSSSEVCAGPLLPSPIGMVNYQGVNIVLPNGMTPDEYLQMSMGHGSGGYDFMFHE